MLALRLMLPPLFRLALRPGLVLRLTAVQMLPVQARVPALWVQIN